MVLLLFVLTASSFKPEHSKAIISDSNPVKTLAEKREIKLYNIRQKALKDALTDYFNKAITSGDIVGAGVSIVSGDSVILSDGYGKRSYNGSEMVDGETLFRLGSISKGFTGVLAANLEREGKLRLKDKVADYLPNFHFGNQQNTQKIEVAHLLSHTTGTPYHSYTDLVEAGYSMSIISEKFDKISPIAVPGAQYSYQNAMFSVSQEVMFKATGKDIQTLLTDKFFTPLGMNSVSMDHQTLINTENIALPHIRRGNSWRTILPRDNYYNAIAAGGINANSKDMAKWMRFLLGHNPEVMSKDAMAQVFKPFVELKGHRKYYQKWKGHLTSGYGLGWRIHTLKENENAPEETIWHHGGSVNNYRNEIALFPDSDLGICVLINGPSELVKTVIPDLRAIVKSIYEQEIKIATSI
ncbi:serine hydrolase [Maribacter hydrothermalis]|uniref:Serine hydrolase n=2 Tax=Maribacter hydrothermalis TaxID=1836467 RepID=A0A1B7ZCU8_9FLAO|nr:serine hydrolase [Maribacter hydrothermalis]OBR40953.1 serine hydrolase [Maribacter hydrothermalis]